MCIFFFVISLPQLFFYASITCLVLSDDVLPWKQAGQGDLGGGGAAEEVLVREQD